MPQAAPAQPRQQQTRPADPPADKSADLPADTDDKKPAEQVPASLGDPNAPVGTPAWLIHQAEALEQERDRLQKRIGKNRDALRGMDELDALTSEQQAWARTFYPEKERGERRSQDEIEATRKVREIARKRKAAEKQAA